MTRRDIVVGEHTILPNGHASFDSAFTPTDALIMHHFRFRYQGLAVDATFTIIVACDSNRAAAEMSPRHSVLPAMAKSSALEG